MRMAVVGEANVDMECDRVNPMAAPAETTLI